MRRRHRAPAVPTQLVARIDAALAAVDRARADLAGALAADAPRTDRRAAYAAVTRAFGAADALLREATRLGRQHSREEWHRWRSSLSRLDAARQRHLFAERDDEGVLLIGSLRAVDTGMSGPAIGELQHGRSREPGAPATYGLDLEAVLDRLPTPTSTVGAPRPAPAVTPVAVPLPLPAAATARPVTPVRAA